MRSWLLVLGLVGACGSPSAPHMPADSGLDARSDAAVDTPVDAPPDAPPDAPSWAISIDVPQFPANPLDQHVVTVVGVPGADVAIKTNRIHAGTLVPDEITLDSSGHGTTAYVPCSDAVPTCVGNAELTVALYANPTNVLATTPIALTATNEIGDISQCMGSANVGYVRATDYPNPPTTWHSTPSSVWSVLTYPDSARFTIDNVRWLELSLEALATPLATGVYTDTQLSPPLDPGLAAISVLSPGCSAGAKFQIDELSADPVLGTLKSFTVRFEQAGCNDAEFSSGCIHYVVPPPISPTPPLADPSKVAVTVLSPSGDGTPDATAIAILTDATGTVVLDTQVDSFGFTQVPLIGSGELTVVQYNGGYEYGHTYRGVHAGDYVIVYPAVPTAGTKDQMLATFPTRPSNATSMHLMTACGGGSWSGGNGLVDADISFYDGCRTPTFSMLSIAGFSDGTPDQWVWQTGLSHVANGNAEVSGTWAPFGTETVTVSNVPANTPALAMALSTKVGQAKPQMDQLRVNGPPAGDIPFVLRYPLGAGDAMVIDLQTQVGLDIPDWITEVLTGSAANLTIDYAANPVPLLSAVQQTRLGASWTESGGGSVDVRTVSWRGDANGKTVTWTIVEPYDGQTSTLLPALPLGHAADDPTTDPSPVLHGAAVLYRDYDVASGFTLVTPPPPYRARQTSAHTYGF